jgi:Leucine-rich repeat (LRR) protein
MRNFCTLFTQTKHYFLVGIAFFYFLTAHAQHITDANFAAAIRADCPTCIDAGDNLTAAAATRTSLFLFNKNISNLTGIGGFPNLEILNVGQNNLTVLPALPTTLTDFRCFTNKLTALPALPNTLKFFQCGGNLLTSLSVPNSLTFLGCYDNKLTSLPSPLPSTLTELYCGLNNITSLPTLPSTLTTLSIDPAKITCLPNLVAGLTVFAATNGNDPLIPTQQLTLCTPVVTGIHIPDANFAAAIRATCPTCIDAGNNLLPPAASLASLVGNDKNISSLEGIQGLTNLKHLTLNSNKITSLPTNLPNTLISLFCSDNQLTSLSTLPSALESFSCAQNPLTSLPTLPNTLTYLRIDPTKITCLPNIPTGLQVVNTSFVSIPTPPLCNPIITCTPTIVTSPTISSTISAPQCVGSSVTLTAVATGTGSLLVKWQCSSGEGYVDKTPSFSYVSGSTAGYTTPILGISDNGTKFRAVFTGTCAGAIPTPTVDAVVITSQCVSSGACTPTITSSPSAASVTASQCGGSSTNLSASATGTTAMTVKWQRKRPSDPSFVDVAAALSYTSGTVAYYTTAALSTADNGTQYQAVFMGSCAGAISVATAASTTAVINTRQGAHIADMYFRNAIRRDCPNCIDGCGNLTESAEQITRLNVDNAASFQPITDLTGIEGFLNLEVLNIGSNTIKIFPRLPNNLKTLVITYNNLSYLPELPNTLETLICKNNKLTALPTLPNSLMHLDCSSNKIAVLPANLPEGLMVLDCSNNELIGLPPSLPLSIKTIYCHKNKIVTLPTLPTALNYFNCGNNLLSDLPPVLPSGLFALICSRNPTLFCLPTLPNTLRELYVSSENITCLRNEVAGLRIYDAMNEPLYNLRTCNATTCVPYRGADNSDNTIALKARILTVKTTESDKASILKMFPNPVDKQVQIEFNAAENTKTTISVKNVLGRQILTQFVATTQGLNAATIDMSSLQRGVYFLIIHDGKTQATQKMVKH